MSASRFYAARYSLFQNLYISVNSRSAHIADSCKLGDIKLTAYVRGIMPVKYTPYELHRLNDGTTCYVSALLKRSRSNLRSLAYKQACILVSLDYNGGISSFVSSGLPILTPLALAFAIQIKNAQFATHSFANLKKMQDPPPRPLGSLNALRFLYLST